MIRKKIEHTIKKIIKYFMIPCGIIWSLFTDENNVILILMYHRINDNIEKELAVKIKSFSWQMEYLYKKNYKVITMDEAYHRILSNKVNNRYVVITFDDGYKDFLYHGIDILKKYNYHSILYLVSDYIETSEVFWWDRDLGKSELLDWEDIKELIRTNIVEIGSHTANHKDLIRLKKEDLEYEIIQSKEKLEKKLGKSISHFCYPRGIYSEEAEKLIKNYYKTAVLITNGKNIKNIFDKRDLTKLKRIPIQRSDGKILFPARLKGWLVLEDVVKRILSRNNKNHL